MGQVSMTEAICAWCDPNNNRPGNHTICDRCLSERYPEEDDDMATEISDITYLTQNDIILLLAALEDRPVTVCMIMGRGYVRNEFAPQISVMGTLERWREEYRVVVNNGSFTYFDSSKVRAVVDRRKRPALDGSLGVFFLDASEFMEDN